MHTKCLLRLRVYIYTGGYIVRVSKQSAELLTIHIEVSAWRGL